MLKIFSKSILLLTILVLATCVIYPGILWVIGQGAFPFQANGSILYDDQHHVIGSQLIAQPFTKDEYFHPRPSAASYDASASTSSALAPSNNALRTRIAGDIAALEKSQGKKSVKNIPADMVTTSASGLDPHISLDNAEFQLDRVAKAWSAKLKRNPADIRNEIAGMLQKNASAPFWGLAGEKFVNVLEMNLALNKQYGSPSKH